MNRVTVEKVYLLSTIKEMAMLLLWFCFFKPYVLLKLELIYDIVFRFTLSVAMSFNLLEMGLTDGTSLVWTVILDSYAISFSQLHRHSIVSNFDKSLCRRLILFEIHIVSLYYFFKLLDEVLMLSYLIIYILLIWVRQNRIFLRNVSKRKLPVAWVTFHVTKFSRWIYML